MTPMLVLVHTMPSLVASFAAWCREALPECRVLHVVDEPMLERIRQRGREDPEDDDRLSEHVRLADTIGASAVLVTCSTVSRSVARVRGRASIPLVAIDDALAAEAVRRGPRIALVATAASTLEPSQALLVAVAARAGREVEVTRRLVEGALRALREGDVAAHDRLVLDAVRSAAVDSDVVVLAQATMAHVLVALADDPPGVAVLASPQLALAEVRRAIFPDAVAAAPAQHEV